MTKKAHKQWLLPHFDSGRLLLSLRWINDFIFSSRKHNNQIEWKSIFKVGSIFIIDFESRKVLFATEKSTNWMKINSVCTKISDKMNIFINFLVHLMLLMAFSMAFQPKRSESVRWSVESNQRSFNIISFFFQYLFGLIFFQYPPKIILEITRPMREKCMKETAVTEGMSVFFIVGRT